MWTFYPSIWILEYNNNKEVIFEEKMTNHFPEEEKDKNLYIKEA